MSVLIPLYGKHANNKFAIVDDDKYEELSKYRWYARHDGYVYRVEYNKTTKKKSSIFMHREVMGLKSKDGLCIDHIDHNVSNNATNNLRICNKQQNNRNRKPISISSQYKGLHKVKFGNKIRWRIKLHTKDWSIDGGTYDYEHIAALRYDQLARRHYGEFAHLNFPSITDYSAIDSLVLDIQITRKERKLSKYNGVSYDKRSKNRPWRATISVKGKRYNCGSFSTEIEAYQARLEAEKEKEQNE